LSCGNIYFKQTKGLRKRTMRGAIQRGGWETTNPLLCDKNNVRSRGPTNNRPDGSVTKKREEEEIVPGQKGCRWLADISCKKTARIGDFSHN